MTKKNSWSHLPNAAHIDRILLSIKTHPEEWAAAYHAAQNAAWFAAYRASRDAAQDAAYRASRDAAWDAAQHAAYDAAWDAAGHRQRHAWAAGDASWRSAGGAIVALIVWDHSAQYLDLPSDQLRVWAVLSDDPACILLSPAVVASEKIKELELA